MSDFAFALLLTAISGFFTVIGGLIALFVKRDNTKFLSYSLGLSAGVMVYISLVEIFPSAYESLSQIYNSEISYILTTASFFLGIGLVIIIDLFVPEVNKQKVATKDFSSLKRTGLMVALVITMHNLPEGLVTFIAALQNPTTGMAIAAAIAIHNIPEGMAVSIPVYYATNSKKKAFYYCLISALAEPVGALVGYMLLFPILNEQVLAIIFALIAGAMVFISIDELLPAASEYASKRLSAYGFASGMLLMALSLILFM
jgi:ZIP family zinc transporter